MKCNAVVFVYLSIFLFFMTGCGKFSGFIEKSLHRTSLKDPIQTTPAAQELHKKLFIIDLHADSLFWGRNLTKRHDYGHVDFPRLIEGNVAIQMFTAFTKVPWNKSEYGWDIAGTIISLSSGWPELAKLSLKERALHQARRLHHFEKSWETRQELCNDSCSKNGRCINKFRIIKSKKDLEEYILDRNLCSTITAGMLGIEGGHALEQNLENMDSFYEAGFRMMSLTHLFDNQLGGSSEGKKMGGLTPFGNNVINKMVDHNKPWLIDLAHGSPTMIDDILKITKKLNIPLITSHTGVKGTCDKKRNISDKHIREIAETGGVISIGYWKNFLCGDDVHAIVRAIRHVVSVIGKNGTDHVGLGSDFDGGIKAPFDSSKLVILTEALKADNFTEDEIHKIMGGNTLRVLRTILPET